jgi:hypothetical protein
MAYYVNNDHPMNLIIYYDHYHFGDFTPCILILITSNQSNYDQSPKFKFDIV